MELTLTTAWIAPARAVVASLALTVALLAAASPASGAVVINEMQSQGTDFVELYNNGDDPVDISGFVVKDSTDNNPYTVPNGTTLASHAFLSFDTPFGLGNADAVRLFDGLGTPLDSFRYASAPAQTYGRCPNGAGHLITTTASSRDAMNSCPAATDVWPGPDGITDADAGNIFGTNLSGLAYQPSGSSAPGVLWAVQNSPSKLYRLVPDGANWKNDTTNGWDNGKTLVYPTGGGAPDAEGVTLAGGDPN